MSVIMYIKGSLKSSAEVSRFWKSCRNYADIGSSQHGLNTAVSWADFERVLNDMCQ